MNRKAIAIQIVDRLKTLFPNHDCDLCLDNALERPMRAPVALLVHYDAGDYGAPAPHIQRVKLLYEVYVRAKRIRGEGDVLDILDAVRDALYLYRIDYNDKVDDGVESRLVPRRDTFVEESEKVWTYVLQLSVDCVYAGVSAS